MNSFINWGMTGRKTGALTMLFVSTSVALSALLASMAAFADQSVSRLKITTLSRMTIFILAQALDI